MGGSAASGAYFIHDLEGFGHFHFLCVPVWVGWGGPAFRASNIGTTASLPGGLQALVVPENADLLDLLPKIISTVYIRLA